MTPDTPNSPAVVQPPIDPRALEALRELGGADEPDLLLQLIEIYLGDAPRRLAEIRTALVGGDWDTLERASHSLKSSSASIGAQLLASCCSQIEEIARQRRPDGLVELVATSESCWPAVESALRAVRA